MQGEKTHTKFKKLGSSDQESGYLWGGSAGSLHSLQGWGSSRETFHVLPKSPQREINPTSPSPYSLGRGSVTDWDPLWHMPGLPLFLNKRLCVLPLSRGCSLLAVSRCQHSCLGPARAAAATARLRNATLAALGWKTDFQATKVRQNHLAFE